MEFVIGFLLGCVLGSAVGFLGAKLFESEKANGKD